MSNEHDSKTRQPRILGRVLSREQTTAVAGGTDVGADTGATADHALPTIPAADVTQPHYDHTFQLSDRGIFQEN